MARKTLAEINASKSSLTTWPFRAEEAKYALVVEYAVGDSGHRRSGSKNHLLRVERVAGYLNGFEPNFRQAKIGGIFSAHSPCNGNGQHVGRVNPSLDLADVNCERCIKAAPAFFNVPDAEVDPAEAEFETWLRTKYTPSTLPKWKREALHEAFMAGRASK